MRVKMESFRVRICVRSPQQACVTAPYRFTQRRTTRKFNFTQASFIYSLERLDLLQSPIVKVLKYSNFCLLLSVTMQKPLVTSEQPVINKNERRGSEVVKTHASYLWSPGFKFRCRQLLCWPKLSSDTPEKIGILSSSSVSLLVHY